MSVKEIQLQIFRFDPDTDSAPRFQTFSVPTKPGMTVLDALFLIQQKHDGSLAFRSSCRAGVCGSCAMHIAGKYRLACETQLLRLGTGTVTVRPMAHLQVLRDLVVDMQPFFDKYRRIRPYLLSGNVPPERERIQTTDERDRLEPSVDCILCGLCTSSCTMTATDPAYLGPAALLKADRFVLDSRDDATQERLRLVDGHDGIWRCHTIFNCQKVCPKDLDPAGGIAHLKRESLKKKLGFGKKGS